MPDITINKLGGDVYEKAGLLTNETNPTGMPSGPGPAGNNFVASGGRRRRRTASTTKTFPKGILRRTSRIIPTSNPSVPSGKTKGGKTTRKHRLRLTTPKGLEKTRRQLHSRVAKTDIKTIRAKLAEKGIVTKDPKKKIPDKILQVLYADSVGAGLIS
jgi:hypothetical protein